MRGFVADGVDEAAHPVGLECVRDPHLVAVDDQVVPAVLRTRLHTWCQRFVFRASIRAPSHQVSASTDGYVPQHFRRHATSILSMHKPITFTHG